MTAGASIGGSRRAVGLGFLALSLIALVPVATTGLPPILDYPNHMARVYVLAMLPHAPDLARFYRAVWSPLPDLALDVVVPPLVRFMPVEIAMRLFLGVMLLAMAGGCLVLHRVAFRRWSFWPLFAFLLLYNRVLLWGFLNYLAGLVLMLWALAAWIALERKRPLLRIAVGTILATLVYLAHLAAFGCYALAAVLFSASPRAGESFSDTPKVRRLAPVFATLTPSIVLFLIAPTSAASRHFGYGNPLRKFDLPVSIFDNYNRIFDGATFGILLIAIIVGLVRRGIVIHPRLRWSAVAVLVAFLAMPSRFLSAAGIDHRLPIAIALLFLAGSDWGALAPRSRHVIAAALLLLFIARMAVIETVWQHADRTYDSLRPIFDRITPGAKIAVAAPAAEVQAGGIALYHFPTLAIIARHAFVDTIFADPLQQPLQPTEEVFALWASQNAGDLWLDAAKGALPPLAGFDYVIMVDPPKGLDTAKLGGDIPFAAPHMILIRLPRQAPAR